MLRAQSFAAVLIAIIIAAIFLGAFPGGGKYAGVAAYNGPLDVVGSAKEWYGLRAASNTLANAGATTTAVIDVRGATTGTSCTIYLLGNGTGGLDFSTAGAGGTGQQCLLGATTFCTVTNTSCTISKVYDQSGANGCSAAPCNLAQGTTADQPTLTFSGLGSLPVMTFTTGQFLDSSTGPTSSATDTLSGVAKYTGAAQAQILAMASGNAWGRGTSANKWELFGAAISATANDSAWHVGQGTNNGVSSSINIDGTETANSGTGSATAGFVIMGATSTGGAQPWIGPIAEAGHWLTAFTSTQRGNMCHNQYGYWGTPTSC